MPGFLTRTEPWKNASLPLSLNLNNRRHRAPPDQAGKAANERHGGALQRPHQRRAGDSALCLRRGPGTDAETLHLAVQSPHPAEGTAPSITYCDDERMAD